MKNIHLTSAQVMAFYTYAAELNRQDSLKSTGSIGKLTEVAFRALVNVSGIKARDVHCRSQKQVDSYTKKLGTVEVKTGSGVAAYNVEKSDAVENPAILFRGCAVAWAPDTIALKAAYADYVNATMDTIGAATIQFLTVAANSLYFMDHDTMVDLLTAMFKKGLQSALKQTGCNVNIQTVSEKPLERFYDTVDAWNIPTVADLLD